MGSWAACMMFSHVGMLPQTHDARTLKRPVQSRLPPPIQRFVRWRLHL